MEKVKVTRHYQITIPAGIRERLGIKEGNVLIVYVEDDKIVFRKLSDNRKRLTFGRKLTLEDIEAGIERGVLNNGSDN
ncbi:AbrB/MazE/SpoVT family DNA-binding domain-containing protein [Vulcanisaeta souniana]|uniref:AbrB family transcriptional regulator n=1 Tax=Vulcanisaeta souniana JCM 11219 TaxID=1293586 RepID=A0A830E0T8_9CREN|nr:AbrB/MazE/SpoVT family DNA-binding domain-containing protein [Vulcanisaeta souniana]BDR92451.1 AbrB family transcriptional regulator [Vulcanisaeta souniana JCM 11219]GGI75634.1 AbrB family transcriptional regulator [Vulcanisaeta souniana JCM 11219]